jgi:hypothetical protein
MGQAPDRSAPQCLASPNAVRKMPCRQSPPADVRLACWEPLLAEALAAPAPLRPGEQSGCRADDRQPGHRVHRHDVDDRGVVLPNTQQSSGLRDVPGRNTAGAGGDREALVGSVPGPLEQLTQLLMLVSEIWPDRVSRRTGRTRLVGMWAHTPKTPQGKAPPVADRRGSRLVGWPPQGSNAVRQQTEPHACGEVWRGGRGGRRVFAELCCIVRTQRLAVRVPHPHISHRQTSAWLIPSCAVRSGWAQ